MAKKKWTILLSIVSLGNALLASAVLPYNKGSILVLVHDMDTEPVDYSEYISIAGPQGYTKRGPKSAIPKCTINVY